MISSRVENFKRLTDLQVGGLILVMIIITIVMMMMMIMIIIIIIIIIIISVVESRSTHRQRSYSK